MERVQEAPPIHIRYWVASPSISLVNKPGTEAGRVKGWDFPVEAAGVGVVKRCGSSGRGRRERAKPRLLPWSVGTVLAADWLLALPVRGQLLRWSGRGGGGVRQPWREESKWPCGRRLVPGPGRGPAAVAPRGCSLSSLAAWSPSQVALGQQLPRAACEGVVFGKVGSSQGCGPLLGRECRGRRFRGQWSARGRPGQPPAVSGTPGLGGKRCKVVRGAAGFLEFRGG